MSGTIESRLKSLGLELPPAPAPVANYVPCHRVGDLLFVSGQVSRSADGKLATGKLGQGVSKEQGKAGYLAV